MAREIKVGVMDTVEMGRAYPGSTSAERFGHSKKGCWTVRLASQGRTVSGHADPPGRGPGRPGAHPPGGLVGQILRLGRDQAGSRAGTAPGILRPRGVAVIAPAESYGPPAGGADEAPGPRGRLAADKIAAYVLGGKAVFTVVGRGSRITYRVERAPGQESDPRRPWFASALTGPGNRGDYSYLGTIWQDGMGPEGPRVRYVHGRKSRISEDAPSARGIAWLTRRISRLHLADVEIWHEGRCCVCGRRLTTPESVESGIGPVCAGRGGDR